MRQGIRYQLISIDIDITINAEAPQIIYASYVIIMDMSNQHTIYLAERHTQELLADIGPASIRIRVFSVSINAAQRKRLSCGSLLRHTSQLQPKTGTPLDVPVPNKVTFINIQIFI